MWREQTETLEEFVFLRKWRWMHKQGSALWPGEKMNHNFKKNTLTFFLSFPSLTTGRNRPVLLFPFQEKNQGIQSISSNIFTFIFYVNVWIDMDL